MMRILLICFMLLSALVTESWAQDRMVTGKVTDNSGESVPGANVILKGTTIGTTADIDGNYKLSVPSDGGTLVFSFVGMTAKEIEIGARSVLDVTMESDAKQLSEVVVTALGVSREARSLGYAVQEIDGKGMTEARETNFVNGLSGKIAGVQVTNSSGAPGSSSSIILRGFNSIAGESGPLFVIDGVPIDNTNYGTAASGGGFDTPNGASSINPDDIESVSVLKGGTAAALYGSRGSNGVILITTKTGKGTKGIGVSVNHETTFQDPLRLPDFQNSYGQGGNANSFQWIDGQTGDGGIDESWGPALDIGLEFPQFTSNGAYPEPWVSNPDNIKDFYETGVTSSTNVSLTAGSEDGSFRLSYTDMKQTGMVPNTDFNRSTISVSSNYNLTDKLYADFSVNYQKEFAENLPTVGYNNENPVQQMIWAGRQVDFAALKDYENLPLAGEGTAAAGTPLNWNTLFQNNPYWVLNTNLNGYDRDRVIGNFKVGYKFTDWLTLQVKSGTDYWSSKTTQQKAKGSNEFPEGLYREEFRTRYEINNEMLLMVNKDITDDFSLNMILGGNRMRNVYSRIIGEAGQLELPEVYNLSNVKSGVTAQLTNAYEEFRVNSIFGSASFGYKNYLFLDVTARNDWFSVLPVDDNSYLYPSVTMSAVITDMFGLESNALSFLKVRAGWADVGGFGALEAYSLQPVYEFRADPWGSVLLPYKPETLNTPDLKPENTTTIEFGLDARLFEGRVILDATYYNTVTSNVLIENQVSAASGYENLWSNAGEITNKGVEISLGATLVQKSDFQWDINVNWAKNTNELTSLGDGDVIILGEQWNMDLVAQVGEPLGAIVGDAFERSPDGEVVYSNGLPVIADETKVLGNMTPDWTGGFGTTVTYKGIRFNALLDSKIGGDVHSMTYTWGRYAGVLAETVAGRETGIVGDGVILQGDGTYIPNNVVVDAETYNKATYSNDVVESAVFDASYIKLRSMSLGYTLPNKLVSKTPFRDVSFSIVGRNLALLYSKAPHIDPETAFSSKIQEQAMEFGQLPSSRSIGFNINFKL